MLQYCRGSRQVLGEYTLFYYLGEKLPGIPGVPLVGPGQRPGQKPLYFPVVLNTVLSDKVIELAYFTDAARQCSDTSSDIMVNLII